MRLSKINDNDGVIKGFIYERDTQIGVFEVEHVDYSCQNTTYFIGGCKVDENHALTNVLDKKVYGLLRNLQEDDSREHEAPRMQVEFRCQEDMEDGVMFYGKVGQHGFNLFESSVGEHTFQLVDSLGKPQNDRFSKSYIQEHYGEVQAYYNDLSWAQIVAIKTI